MIGSYRKMLLVFAEHFVARPDGARVDLVGPLGGDQIHQFVHHLDVGLLQEPGLDRAEAFLPGRPDHRRTAGVGRRVQVVALAGQAGGIDEAGQLDRADHASGRRSNP